ncbi:MULTISPECIES: FAD-dependent monooxygenase [unclassified Pseudoalteromonas]|uniref:FAD-dependent monooxygenase n=1 Tax=unclassified Pseudoalteromonas TaxID=194690 RepID=UPI002096A36B|nr:FAD-dependent monooxygenase [Pseudoalteromonas sp. XMcav2-N]MCO7188175.1 FAD-dependent monooxygenase [Pseudoalteromonas sp. XMcav2-N]
MQEKRRIAIIGAGIAGMALALLVRKQGHQVVLYERTQAPAAMGAGVTLWPNALFVLEQMGLTQQIVQAGGLPDSLCQYDHRGTEISALSVKQLNKLSGYLTVTILRRDLIRLLADALTALGGVIRFNTTISHEEIDGLRKEYDLVVGADGRMNSAVRQYLYPQHVQPVYQGVVNVIGISKAEPGTLNNSICDFRRPGERFGIVPVKKNLCFWAGAWRSVIEKNRPGKSLYHELNQRFSSWAEPVRSVLKAADTDAIQRIFVHDLDTLPYWHRDNVVLIGDAAHASLPTSGQGACQALEDAWHLAGLISKYDDPSVLLSTFYERRIAKATAAQHSGRQLARQIFFAHHDSPTERSPLSVAKLNQLWMQGLES